MIQEELIKMSICQKIKGINNKIKQNTAQYDLDKQTAKISASLSGNFSNYELLTGKNVKAFLEIAGALKIFEYLPLDKELKKQTSVVEKHYQKFDNDFEYNEKEEVKIRNEQSHANSTLVHKNFLLQWGSNIQPLNS